MCTVHALFLSVALTLSFPLSFGTCLLSLKMSFQDFSPSVSCTSSVHATFSSFSPLCFLYSMSSPPIWPGSPFYRKNKGVLLQGRVTCLTVFTCCEPSFLSLMCFWFHWQVLFIIFFTRISSTTRRDLGLFACFLDEPFIQQKAHIHVPG